MVIKTVLKEVKIGLSLISGLLDKYIFPYIGELLALCIHPLNLAASLGISS